MHKKFYFVLFLLSIAQSLSAQSLSAQSGKIISQRQIHVPDTLLPRLAKYYPGVIGLADSTTAYKISYLSDGLKINGYLVEPKKPGKYPCIIYNRGGNREFGKLDEYDYGFYMAQLASWGYVVIGSQYRGNDSSEGKEEFGGKDMDDVLNLFEVLAHLEKADSSRIGMYGASRGGMMTYIALKKTCRLKAAVVLSGITDLIKLAKDRPAMDTNVFQQLIPKYFSARRAELEERSAVYFVDSLCKTTPLFILQGTADWRVPTDQVIDLTGKLYAAKIPFRFSLFEGGTHGVDEYWEEVSRQTRVFLNAYLRDLSAIPSLKPHGF